MDSFNVCGCFNRKFSQRHLVPPPEIEKLFNQYAENGVMTAEQVKVFLDREQGEVVSVEDARKIIESHLQLLFKSKDLNLEQFFNYLLDPKLNPVINNQIHHDMTGSLAHYFIFTGHNSYLTGNQLSSTCSEVPIINALKRGVRVIELDLWPNSAKDNIHVTHGRTMVTPVLFEKCIVAIRDNAFVASPFPVIISFEDHLSSDLQAKAAEIVTRVLGELLYYPDEHEQLTEFPSPEKWKRCILISTKPPKECLEGKKLENRNGKTEGLDGTPLPTPKEEGWGEEIPEYDTPGENVNQALAQEESENDSPDESPLSPPPHPAYEKLISINAGKPKGKKSLKDSLVPDEFVRRFALSEPQIQKLAKEDCSTLLIRFSSRNILKVFPFGLRFDSSNFNPMVAWSHGAQLLAFNMQGYGRPLWLVQGLFRANGGCGYVKKPGILLSANSSGQWFDPHARRPVKGTLKVKVILGLGWREKFGKRHFDNFSPPDFYVRVGIAGVQADTIMKKTSPVEDDWLPQWDCNFEFPLTVPELALLRVEVHEYDLSDKDDFGGQTCLPVSELKTGYRVVPLYDKKGDDLGGVKVLMHFQLVPAS